MLPTTIRSDARAMSPATRGATDASSVRAVAGFILTLIGFVVGRLPSLLLYYYFAAGMSLVEYSQITGGMAILGFLLVGVGLFLLLRELGRWLPTRPGYLRYTPIIVLAGALLLVAEGLVYLWILPALYGGSLTTPFPEDVFIGFQVADWSAEVVIGISVLLSMFGAVRVLVAGTPPVVFPPPP